VGQKPEFIRIGPVCGKRTRQRGQRSRELPDHRLIHASPDGAASAWPFQNNGSPFSVRIAPQIRLNTNDAALDFAAQGWELTRLRSYQIAARIASGDLVTVLNDFELPPQPVHVIHQEGRRALRKVRAFVDFVVDRLRADPSIS